MCVDVGYRERFDGETTHDTVLRTPLCKLCNGRKPGEYVSTGLLRHGLVELAVVYCVLSCCDSI